MTKRLFHLMPEAEFEAMEAAGATWTDVKRKYRQPSWCDYPDALGGGAPLAPPPCGNRANVSTHFRHHRALAAGLA